MTEERMYKYTCGRQNKAPKDIHVLIFHICEYVKLHGKRNLEHEVKGLGMGRVSWIIHAGPVYS